MKQRTEVGAVELVRKIRDRQAQQLRGMSDAEIITFFRKAGDSARRRARRSRSQPESRPMQPPARKARRG